MPSSCWFDFFLPLGVVQCYLLAWHIELLRQTRGWCARGVDAGVSWGVCDWILQVFFQFILALWDVPLVLYNPSLLPCLSILCPPSHHHLHSLSWVFLMRWWTCASLIYLTLKLLQLGWTRWVSNYASSSLVTCSSGCALLFWGVPQEVPVRWFPFVVARTCLVVLPYTFSSGSTCLVILYSSMMSWGMSASFIHKYS